jgi:hypothetical protein
MEIGEPDLLPLLQMNEVLHISLCAMLQPGSMQQARNWAYALAASCKLAQTRRLSHVCPG